MPGGLKHGAQREEARNPHFLSYDPRRRQCLREQTPQNRSANQALSAGHRELAVLGGLLKPGDTPLRASLLSYGQSETK